MIHVKVIDYEETEESVSLLPEHVAALYFLDSLKDRGRLGMWLAFGQWDVGGIDVHHF